MINQPQDNGGRIFRQAWIDGVTAHFPGAPKPGYIAPWQEMPEWEQHAAATVFTKARALIVAGLQAEPPVQLTAEQGGRYIAEAWIVQVYRHISQPKPGYVADWDELPEWQRETDKDIFKQIETVVLQEQHTAV